MTELYACHLLFDGAAEANYVLAQRRILDWALQRYGQRAIEDSSGDLVPQEGVSLSWSTLASPSGSERLWSLSWRYPHHLDTTLVWQVTANVGADAEASWASIRISLGAQTFRLAPTEYDLKRPGIVPKLVAEMDVSIDGRRLRVYPQLVTSES